MLANSIFKFFKNDIDVYTKTLTLNSFGELTKTWTKDRTIFGRIRPLSGNERFQAGSRYLFATHRLYTEDSKISEEDQIIFNNSVFNVLFTSNPMNMSEFYQVDLELVR